jgi:hypothetical protein
MAGNEEKVFMWQRLGSWAMNKKMTCDSDMSASQNVPCGIWVDGDVAGTNQWQAATWQKSQTKG